MLAENCWKKQACPRGIIQVVNGDKESVDAILHHPVISVVGFVRASTDRRNTSMARAVCEW